MWFSVTLKMNFVGSDKANVAPYRLPRRRHDDRATATTAALIPFVPDARVRPEDQHAQPECLHRTDEIIQRSSSSPSASESIDSLPMLRGDKVALRAARMRGGIERVKISRAVHESNRGHCRGEVKQAGPAIRGGEQSRRVSTISGHVLSPFGSKRLRAVLESVAGCEQSPWGRP